ncbi:phosphatase PAP2 family protein [Mesorhizobium sp. ZMM04-5]|uniref:Phosphatase PAP2 family protein n=1 Tax=Mesorhizobium marinum TaxID=3228790 RepID=A0ABV3R4K1_9HYPH
MLKYARHMVLPYARTGSSVKPVDPIELVAQSSVEAGVRERDWLVPATVMTAGLGLAALLLMPVAGYDQIPDYFSRFLHWMYFMFFGGMLLLILYMVRLWRAGVKSPIAHLKANLLTGSGLRLLAAVAGAMLGGIDMLFFMWIKPEVTAVSPFWADAMLANVDHAIFRTDPWRFFEGMDLTFHAWAYSFFWAFAVMATMIWLLAQRPSAARSASLISYFALWSIFGPIGQYFFSSAGPIFYDRLAFGSRFDELIANLPDVTLKVSGYLWTHHATGTLGVGAGISAMPSLHIATVVWIYIVFRSVRSRVAPFAAAFAVYIWALSVGLGWHYAVDGIVGAAGAVASQWLCSIYLRRMARKADAEEPVFAAS